MKLLPLILFASACSHHPVPDVWVIPGHGKVQCRQVERDECGLKLKFCGPEGTQNFHCVQTAKYFGRHPVMPADYGPQPD